MNDKKTGREQIEKYLKGKLDARAMHKLERGAQDDPFFMDALEGYEAAGEQDANLAELKELLDKRIAPKKERSILLWRVLPIAACLLIALMAGYWYFAPKPVKQQYAAVIKPDKITVQPAVPQAAVVTQPKEATVRRFAASLLSQQPTISAPQPNKMIAANPTGNSITYKTDTVEYHASDYKVRTASTVDELLKHMEGFNVDSNGSVTHQGQAVAKARLNGRDYAGGNLAQAIQKLPADIVEKIQVVDDYGDQAARTGVKDGDPTKVLNITTDSSKRKLVAANGKAKALALKEVNINGKNVAEPPATTPLTSLQGRVAGLKVNQDISTNSSYHTITGVVMDEKGQPIIGAAVKVDGTATGIATDVKGNFKIDVPTNNETLDVNYVGYAGKQIKAGNQENLKITLNADQNSLNEVSVVGYGSQVKRDATRGPADATRTITGKIVSKEDGLPLPGATVKITGTQQSVQTNADGKFSITVPATSKTLDIQYTGYLAQQINMANGNNLNIALETNGSQLSEVVVTGTEGRKTEEKATGYAEPRVDNTNKDARPSVGTKAYDAYLKENAVMPDNTTGTVELGFTVAADGTIINIRVISGKNKAMNDKAIEILKTGPKWIGGSLGKETRLKIVFHK